MSAHWLKKLCIAVIMCCFVPTAVHAQTASDLTIRLSDSRATQPAITVKNTSQSECQILDTAQGTVALTKVQQSSKAITPAAIDAASDEDIGFLLKDHFKTLKPGQEIAIPLQSYELASGQTLRATSWSQDGGAYTTEYQVNKQDSLVIDAAYTIPIEPTNGPRACVTPAFLTSITPNSMSLIVAVIVLILLIIMAFAIWWFRFKNKTKKAPKVGAPIAVLVALTGAAATLQAQPVAAEVSAAPQLQAAYNSCMSTLSSNRDITGPVLNVLNAAGVRVQIVPTTGGSETTGRREGTNEIFTIYWNPNDRHPYAGTGGSADPCTSLYHEMYHVLDMHNGTFSRNDCAGSGIETKEVMATRAQNALRVRLGMPARSHYGDRALPTGDCNAPPRAPTCSGTRCADSNGDPHLRTFDGLRYDFQAAGEFIAAKDESGKFEVQTRQQAWGASRDVAVNTAAAFKVNDDTVEVRSGKELTILVNKKQVKTENAALAGGGSIELDNNVIIVKWPDQSLAYVRSVGSYGIAVSLELSDALSGKMQGLFGDADGSTENDLRTRNSSQTIKPEFDSLYPTFADSWRITDETSLFTYENNQTTATFTDKSMPEKPAAPDSLPGYAAAEKYCASLGITDPGVLANCALDLAITGQTVFAKTALYSQLFALGAAPNGTSWQSANVSEGSPLTQTFDAKAGEKVFIHIPKTNLPSQCGTLELRDPQGKEIASGCIIGGKGFIDGITLPDTGKYTVHLKPQGSGSVAIKLLRIADKSTAMNLDGPEQSTAIDQPGVVARYTFSGKANQRVYVSVPKSTIGSQCGILRLYDPSGNLLSNGCIINNVGGIDTTSLPADGTYTVVLDPNDTTTGVATMQLIASEYFQQSISMNGPALQLTFNKIGSTAELRFTGSAGQKIFVTIPTSTLPSQCGIIKLREPDGSMLESGCIINGKGELAGSAVTLKSNGVYAIIIDPHDTATGTAQVQLRQE